MTLNGKVNGKKIKSVVTAIIQARMQSKRLPGKVMLDLAGKPVLGHVIERAKAIEHVDKVVLATSSNTEDKVLVDLAYSMEIEAFAGSEQNVLDRYFSASEKFGGEYIIRITADNPFTDVDYASMIVDIALESKFDLCSLTNLPIGTAVEVIRKEALDEAHRLSREPHHLEHVTTFIKEHPELFSIEKPAVSIKKVPGNMRLTIDTIEDYELAKILYKNLYNGIPFPLSDIINYINEHPDILKINSEIKQRLATHSAI
jgi:spore coat polysaccharide biosynthesis protein SpsF